MVDYSEMRRKFRAKSPKKEDKGRSVKKIKEQIAREYELKKAELKGGAPNLKKSPLFYFFAIGLLLILLIMILTAAKNDGLSLSKKRIERTELQARKSMDALTIALGRYKFHTGEYPSTEEGLAVLALKAYPKKGWDGPYVNHIVKDPWGHDYVYETRPEGGHPILYSKGADGRAGSTDDVMPDQAGFDQAFKDTSWTNGWAPYRLRGIVVAPDEATKRRVQEEMKEYDVK